MTHTAMCFISSGNIFPLLLVYSVFLPAPKRVSSGGVSVQHKWVAKNMGSFREIVPLLPARAAIVWVRSAILLKSTEFLYVLRVKKYLSTSVLYILLFQSEIQRLGIWEREGGTVLSTHIAAETGDQRGWVFYRLTGFFMSWMSLSGVLKCLLRKKDARESEIDFITYVDNF